MTDRESPIPTMTLGLVSIPVKENDFQHNLEAVAEVIAQYSSEAIDLFVFGEANLTGLNTTHFKSRTFLDTTSALQAINRVTGEYHASICVGFIEHEAEKFYLTHVLSSDGTTCGMQRKVLAANPTKPSVYTSGKQINPIIFRGYKVVILACADWLTPEPMMQAGIHEPDLILAPTDQFHWEPHSRSVHTKAGQGISFWLQAPLAVAFNSEINPEPAELEVCACLGYDHKGDEVIRKSKKQVERTIYTMTVELKKRRLIWGGFEARRNYVEN